MAEILDIFSDRMAHPKSRGMNSRSLLISLLVSCALLLLQLLLFTLLRKRFPEVYEPRTFMVPKKMRVVSHRGHWGAWIIHTIRVPLSAVRDTAGLDAYFFLRYLVVLVCLNGLIAVLMVPILMPLHCLGQSSSGRDDVHWLDKLSISNLSPERNHFLVAHVLLCFMVVAVCLFVFQRELRIYHHIKAQHMLQQVGPYSSTVLLIKGLYSEFRSEEAIRHFFSDIPGSVRNIWFNRDYQTLPSLVRKAQRTLHKLETTANWLVIECQRHSKAQMRLTHSGTGEANEQDTISDSVPVGRMWQSRLDEHAVLKIQSQLNKLFILKSELSRINVDIFLLQSQKDLFPTLNSCFVQFDNRLACFMAHRAIGASPTSKHSRPGSTYIDKVYSSDVVWHNLATETFTERALQIAAIFTDYTIIFGWAVPIAIVSMVTQVETLSRLIPSLNWMAQFPRVSQMMSSVISPVLLSWLTSQVPHLFRGLANLKGYPTRTLIEMDVQKYLFLFMFVQLFLIMTLATGLPSFLTSILMNTSEGAISLASSLPKATNFFMSYLIASSFMSSGNTLLQTETLVRRSWTGLRSISPRQKLDSFVNFTYLQWGSVYPLATNICAISLTYALVSPIILLASVVAYLTMFLAYKYRIIYCHVPRCNAEGDYYPRAIFQLFSGMYCQELSLLGTLLLRNMLAPSLMVAIMVVLTIISQHYLTRSFHEMNVRIPLGKENAFPDNISESNISQNTVLEPQEEPAGRTPAADSDITIQFDQLETLFDSFETDFDNLTTAQKKFVSCHLFEHPAMRQQRPCVWLARDKFGIAEDQVNDMLRCFTDLRASCSGAELVEDGRILLRHCPPDFEAPWLMRL